MNLCDTGPLIALIDRDDVHHTQCVASLASLPPHPLLTTWPCLTEAMHLLYRIGGQAAQEELWGFISEGSVRIHLPSEGELNRIHDLMHTYADMPLDLADASLMAAAETRQMSVLFSIDQRLRAIRLKSGSSLHLVP